MVAHDPDTEPRTNICTSCGNDHATLCLDCVQAKDSNTQQAPYPLDLAALVEVCAYRPGWQVRLEDMSRGQGSIGLTLVITTHTVDTYHPDRPIRVQHLFPVPPAAYDIRSWQRWLFDQFLLVEQHECMEFFKIGEERPYAPSHGPGNDPYMVREVGTEIDQRTSFRGEVSPASA